VPSGAAEAEEARFRPTPGGFLNDVRDAAIYARISTGKQSQLSPESQIRKCREAAEARGFRVLERHIYRDDGLSGVGFDRPAFQQLMTAALSRPSAFHAIFVDDTSRLSRATEDSLSIFKRLNFAGVQLVAVSQAIDSTDEQADVLMTVHGLVDSLYVKELRKKVHRGLDERARRGLHTGGRCYGYATVGAEGGKRVVLISKEAEIVKRVFQMSAGGYSLKSIAKALNAEGIDSPRPRKDRHSLDSRPRGWCYTAVREMLRNERYLGRLIWNRTQFVKVPGTNRRIARPRPRVEWIEVVEPNLRIVSDELWGAVRDRQRWLATNFGKLGTPGLLSRHASSGFLFSGLLYCSECGGRLTVICGHGKKNHRRYGCSRNFNRGTCSNALRERQDRIEARLLADLQAKVLHPDVVNYALTRFEEELRKANSAQAGQTEPLRERQAQLKRELRNLAETAAQVGPSASLVGEIGRREREITAVEERLANQGSDSTAESMDELRKFVVQKVADVRWLLNADTQQVKAEIMRHVTRIEMRPVNCPGERGCYLARGNWNLLGNAFEKDRAPHVSGGGARMVAGVRFELTTFGL
jgi:site-specific DNA recombinase